MALLLQRTDSEYLYAILWGCVKGHKKIYLKTCCWTLRLPELDSWHACSTYRYFLSRPGMHYCPKAQIDASLCFIWVLCTYSNSLVLQMLFFTNGINITWELFRNLNYQSLQGMGPSNPCFVLFNQELFGSMRLAYCDSDTHRYRIFFPSSPKN